MICLGLYLITASGIVLVSSDYLHGSVVLFNRIHEVASTG